MLLQESNFQNIIYEASEDKKNLFLNGVFLQGADKNRNGRIYPVSEIKRAVDKINETINAGEDVLGELDHPPSLEVKLRDVSHKIVSLKMEGSNAIGKSLILPTPAGNIAKALIESNIRVGVSSRGSGDVNESTGEVKDFNIVTIDLVATPSAQNAYPTSVMEHLEYFKRRNELMDLAEAVNHDPNAQVYMKKEIEKFIRDLFEG